MLPVNIHWSVPGLSVSVWRHYLVRAEDFWDLLFTSCLCCLSGCRSGGLWCLSPSVAQFSYRLNNPCFWLILCLLLSMKMWFLVAIWTLVVGSLWQVTSLTVKEKAIDSSLALAGFWHCLIFTFLIRWGKHGLDKTAGEWGQGCRYMLPESSYQWLIVKTESGAGRTENTTCKDRLIKLHLLAEREVLGLQLPLSAQQAVRKCTGKICPHC